MASKRTDNLNLHAWERTDAFMMDEFNENFDAIDKAIAAKAEQTALEAETAARSAELATLTGRVDKKAEQTVLEAGLADLAALTGRVGALDTLAQGRLRFKFGEYPGTNEFGADHPNSLTFDFKPMVLFIVQGDSSYGGYSWIRPQQQGGVFMNPSVTYSAKLTWEEKAVSWYSNSAAEQLNRNGKSYYYAAIGIAE